MSSQEAPKRRNPRTHPEPGDRLERGGMRYTVREVSLFTVAYDVEGFGSACVALAQWRRLTKGALVLSSAPCATGT